MAKHKNRKDRRSFSREYKAEVVDLVRQSERVGLAHVRVERPTGLVVLETTADDAVRVVVDLWRDPAGSVRLEMRPGDEPKRWWIPIDTVFEQGAAYHYHQQWLLPPSRVVEVGSADVNPAD